MNILSKEKKLHKVERTLHQLDGEDINEYKMLIDYIHFKNIPDLVSAYRVSTRTIYNIKKKNKWNERIAEYKNKCSKIYIKETFSLIDKYQNKNRDNLMNLAFSVQNVIENFNECIYTDPLVLQNIFKKDQMEMISIVRQSTRALIDLHKLDTTIIEKLKFHGIDLSPEFLQKFEQEEILGDSMLELEFDTEEIIGNSPFKPFCPSSLIKFDEETPETPMNTDSSLSREVAALPTEGVSEIKQEDKLQAQLTKAQNFIEQTKKQLEEFDKETTSSVINPVETPENSMSSAGGGGCEADGGGFSDNYEEDEEDYYDEFAPENHRYPFPMEYLIPVTER